MEIGKIIKEKAKEYYIIMMVIDMKENKIIKEKAKEYYIIMMVIDMKENLKMI